jgi:uncharacterized repeat protein (TIGR01451 family)
MHKSIFLAILSFFLCATALADGTETLGPPGITIESGTGVIVAGVGLANQPGDIIFDVPAGATVQQVLLYWEGQDFETDTGGDDTISVEGSTVTGTKIGGPIFWPDDGVSTTYRADITGLGLVAPGSNTLTVGGLGDFTNFANGAGVLVIVDDGASPSSIEIRDGNDLAWIGWGGVQQTTVAQTFTFDAASEARTASLSMFFSAVSGTNSSAGNFRPTAIDVTVGGVTTTFDNLLDSIDGQEWDTLVLPVPIPANATTLTVQAFSVDNLNTGGLPASLTWNAAALSIPAIPAPDPGIDIEKLTNGNQADGANDGDVPQIAQGDTVTWTYLVANTGSVDFSEAEVMVTDDQPGVTPVLDSASDAGSDLILSVGETWTYTAVSQALDLSTASGVTVVDGCNDDRPTYENMGKVVIDRFDLMDTDLSHYCNPGEPDIDIRKQTEGPDSRTFPSGSDVPFDIVVTNTGTVDLFNVVVSDILVPQCDRVIGSMAVGAIVTYTCTAPDVTRSFTNEACVSGEDGDGNPVADCDPSTVEIPPAGGEGCTPGFWKQSQHFPAWLNPPYAPSTQFSAVFDNAFPGMTLLQVLRKGGGGLRALGRHTVAALLNAATADVSYDIGTPQDVIDAFNEVYPGSRRDYNGLKNEFERLNEQGCPINGKSPPSNL